MAEEQQKKQQKKIALVAQQFKDEYGKLGSLDFVLQDLRVFCAINPKDMVGGNNNIDTNKSMIMAGRAMVFERIDYFLSTPVEQIVQDMTIKFGA